jgi:integrase/predicted nucleotidyltransferase
VATLRERRPGVWEIRVFTGRDAAGRPTQISRTMRGTKREAQRVAASLESRPPSNAAGRTVTDVLTAWRDVNQPVWAESTRRDYESRISKIEADPIAEMAVARLRVADVERWHTRMRKAGVGEAAIRGRHGVLRAALAQALRWEWVGSNAASQAVLRQPKRSPRDAMSADEVRAAITAARGFDPAAGVALRLAAVAGLRRAELAALQWSDVERNQLTIDSSACVVRRGGESYIEDIATKTGNRRVLTLDPATVDEVVALRAVREQVSPYLFSDTTEPAHPDRIGWWWSRARERSGIDRKWRLHDLRHWTATTAITSGHDVRTVAGRLGHANPAMTLRVYAHAVEGADRAIATSLAATLDGDSESPAPDASQLEHSTGMDVLARLGADRDAVTGFCRRNDVRRLAVFGSALRDDFTPHSDVDLLVEFLPDANVSLFDMARMEMELEEIFRDRRIDLRTAGDLGARFRDAVVAEAQAVYDVAA